MLNLITGLLKPTAGSVKVDGLDVATLDDRVASTMRNRTIGFAAQSSTLLSNLTVLDNVILPAIMTKHVQSVIRDDPHASLDRSAQHDDARAQYDDHFEQHDVDMPDVITPHKEDIADPLTKRAHALLTSLLVDNLSECRPKELSGGEMRRVSIARALMNNPKLLIADEPTGDLDAESTATVMNLLRDEADRGTAVLMVTHDPDALAYVDRTYRMDRGVLVAV